MAGLPAKTVRDMLRRLNIYSLMDALFVAARCKVSSCGRTLNPRVRAFR